MDELHLFRFPVPQRGRPFQRIEVILVEFAFRHRGCLAHGELCGPRSHNPAHHSPWLEFAHVAGHQLDPRVRKRFSALVVERHPGHHVQHVPVLRRYDVVIRLPFHSAGHVAQLHRRARRFVRFDLPVERRLQDRVVRQRRKHRHARQRKLQFTVDLDDRLPGPALRVSVLLHRVLLPVLRHRGVVRHVAAAHDLSRHHHVFSVFVFGYEFNRFSFVQPQQQLLRHGIVPVVLLQHRQPPGPARVPQDQRVGFQVRRDVRKRHVVLPRLELQQDHLPHHGKHLVVNGQRSLPRRFRSSHAHHSRRSQSQYG